MRQGELARIERDSLGHVDIPVDNRGRQRSNSSLFVNSSVVASFAFSKEHGSHDL